VRRLTGKAPGALLNANLELGAAGAALRRTFEAAWCGDVLNLDQVWAGMRDLLGPPPKQLHSTLSLVPEPTIAAQAAAAGLSTRHFRRRFEREWGVSPKIWQRLLRVNALAIALHPAPWDEPTHNEPALLFVDQPHMIREFKAMTGLTPRAYKEAMLAHPIGAIRSVPLC
jgi:AraC-like DNA-binding protein